MTQTAKQIIFIGRVQGVGFRFTALSMARRCELTGIVRNLPDGSVEVVAQGEAQDIDDCIRDLKESFSIRETKITEISFNPNHTSFKITY